MENSRYLSVLEKQCLGVSAHPDIWKWRWWSDPSKILKRNSHRYSMRFPTGAGQVAASAICSTQAGARLFRLRPNCVTWL